MTNKHMERCSTSPNHQRNINQNNMRCHFKPIRIAIPKIKQKTKCCQECGELEAWYSVLGMQMVQLLWRKVWVSSKNKKNRSTIWSNNSTSGHIPQGIESKVLKRCLQHTCVHSSINAIAKVEVTQCPTTECCSQSIILSIQ